MSTTRALNAKDAATRLGISVGNLYARVARREIACYRLGTGPSARLRFTDADLDTYLARQRHPAIAERVAMTRATTAATTPFDDLMPPVDQRVFR